MYRRLVFALALGLGSALVHPAAAEDEEASRYAGTRVDDAGGGFKLVTHGVWPTPTRTTASIAGLPNPAPVLGVVPTGLAKAAHATSFRRAMYLPQVYAAEARYRLPPGLLDALIWTESRYNPMAVSRAGAAGLGQLMPGTARDVGVANRFDPSANLIGAARYLRQQLDRFGLVHLAVAAYNAGPAAVERAGGIPFNGETPRYVRNVLGFWGPK